jgi:hypothetical protein
VSPACDTATVQTDFAFVALAVGFFVLAAAYAYFCRKIR